MYRQFNAGPVLTNPQYVVECDETDRTISLQVATFIAIAPLARVLLPPNPEPGRPVLLVAGAGASIAIVDGNGHAVLGTASVPSSSAIRYVYSQPDLAWIPEGAGAGGGGGLMKFTVFVAKNGNDATADGSVGKPFLTVQAAMEYAYATYVLPIGPQPIPPFTRPCVFVNAGTYDDGDLVLPPQICVMGEGYNHTRIRGDWTIDTRWSNYDPPSLPSPPSVLVPSDFRSSWINVGLFGNVSIDFEAAVSNEGKLYATNVRFGGDVTITEKTENPVSNQLIFTASEFTGDVTLNGIPATLLATIGFGGTLTLNQAVGTGVDNIVTTAGGSLGPIVVNATNAGAPPYVCSFGHSVKDGAGLTLNGPFSAIHADTSSLPLQSLITLAGGATLDQIRRTNQPNFSGTTASRPTIPYVGQQFFDTSIGRPIWWDGTNWITTAPWFKFSGFVAAHIVNPSPTSSFADPGYAGVVANTATAIEYRLALPTSFSSLAVEIRDAVLAAAPQATLTFIVLKNGAPTGLTVAFTGPLAPGAFAQISSPVSFAQDDRLSLIETSTGGFFVDPIAISATLA